MNIKDYISKSNSQAGQDIFAIWCNQGLKNGYYVDCGACEPFAGNNSALLEKEFNFSGFSIEYVDWLCAQFNQNRKNPCFNYDLTKKGLTELLDEQNAPKVIDYLSHDLDFHPARIGSLKTFDFNKYKIKCLTWENDEYDGGEQTKIDGEKFLEDNGMKLVCRSVKWQRKAFETWAVNPELVSEAIWGPLECEYKEYTEILERMI